MYKDFNGREVLTLSTDIYIQLLFPLLSFADIANLGRTRGIFLNLSRNNSYWQTKFELHFPHYYRYAKESQHKDINWYFAFIKATAIDYAGLNKEQQQVFIRSKEGDKAQIIKYLNFDKALLAKAVFYTTVNRVNPRLHEMNKITEANNLTPLNWLIRNDHQHVLDGIFLYLEAQRNINEKKMARWALRCNQAPLHYTKLSALTIHRIVAELGLIAKMQNNIEKNFNLNQIYIRKNINKLIERKSALHIAASKGYTNLIALLLEKNAEHSSLMTRPVSFSRVLNHFDPGICKSITPLHCAAEANHFEVAVLLVRAGASPFERDTYNNSPLEYAVANDNKVMFEFFIDQLNKDNYDQLTLDRALYQAICRNYSFYSQRLIESGAKASSKESVNDIENNSVNFDQEKTRARLILDHQNQLAPEPFYLNKWLAAGVSGLFCALLWISICLATGLAESKDPEKSTPIGAVIALVLGAVLGYLYILYRNCLKRGVLLVPTITENNNTSELVPLLTKKIQAAEPDIEQGKVMAMPRLPVEVFKQNPRSELLKLLGYFKTKVSQEELKQIEASFKPPSVSETVSVPTP
jgi:ankyrin repeat protein